MFRISVISKVAYREPQRFKKFNVRHVELLLPNVAGRANVVEPYKECVISLRALRFIQYEHLTLALLLSLSHVQSDGDFFFSKIEQSSVLVDNGYRYIRSVR